MLSEILSIISGFSAYELTTHPKRTIRKKMKTLKIGRFEILPCLRLHLNDHTLHIHHWCYCLLFLALSTVTNWRWLDSNLTQSFLLGATLQGLRLKKSRRILYPNPLEVSDDYR